MHSNGWDPSLEREGVVRLALDGGCAAGDVSVEGDRDNAGGVRGRLIDMKLRAGQLNESETMKLEYQMSKETAMNEEIGLT